MNLTREEARQWIPILQAFVEGKEFQMWGGVYDANGDRLCKADWTWIDIDTTHVFPMSLPNHMNIERPDDYFRIKEQ